MDLAGRRSGAPGVLLRRKPVRGLASIEGIDVADPSGADIVAPAGGTVTFAGSVPGGGKTVSIRTDDGYSVTLVHLGSIGVLKGAVISEGSSVGGVGPSGTPEFDQPYVHLGIRVASDPQGYVDPLGFLPPRPAVAPKPAPPASAPAAEPAPVSPPVTAPAGATAPAASAEAAPAAAATQPPPPAEASSSQPAAGAATTEPAPSAAASAGGRFRHGAHDVRRCRRAERRAGGWSRSRNAGGGRRRRAGRTGSSHLGSDRRRCGTARSDLAPDQQGQPRRLVAQPVAAVPTAPTWVPAPIAQLPVPPAPPVAAPPVVPPASDSPVPAGPAPAHDAGCTLSTACRRAAGRSVTAGHRACRAAGRRAGSAPGVRRGSDGEHACRGASGSYAGCNGRFRRTCPGGIERSGRGRYARRRCAQRCGRSRSDNRRRRRRRGRTGLACP